MPARRRGCWPRRHFSRHPPPRPQAQMLPGMLKPGAAPAEKPVAEKGAEAQKVDLPAQLEQKLAEARAELARIEAPDGAAAGAPAGTPERDLVRRRVLWQQLARTYQRHLDELANLEVATKRRAELEQRIAAWQGFPEKPPYPILKADDLRKQLQTASLKLDGFQAKQQMLDKQIDGARDFLKNAEEEVRQAREKLERAKSQAESVQAAWQLDLARLTSRVPAAAIASLEAGRRANQEQLAAARQESEFGERMLKEVEGKTRLLRRRPGHHPGQGRGPAQGPAQRTGAGPDRRDRGARHRSRRRREARAAAGGGGADRRRTGTREAGRSRGGRAAPAAAGMPADAAAAPRPPRRPRNRRQWSRLRLPRRLPRTRRRRHAAPWKRSLPSAPAACANSNSRRNWPGCGRRTRASGSKP
ncbi:MAG: hypothetical protein MZW92_13450 [Comamonadaceae bacterium]|nr:hypothetical protein [Comamonadaceae bacterium]